ncbi:carbamoyltransferase HypF [Pontibacter sp. MBLB2868]|uniref:carbamoyltransferase HypF n=1 Tax=Pontibacter sp. MBLB2868 TaxID=3451555 RepID=UPI003F7517DD
MKKALHIQVAGAVQGVGFRPFVYRLAHALQLTGYVMNSGQGVRILLEGPEQVIRQFVARLASEAPSVASIDKLDLNWQKASGLTAFSINHSAVSGPITASVLPDLATCPDCLAELFDPKNRRYRYPFLNCTHCGPRFSILEALPYDRPNTTMKGFTMCENCQREYEDPLDRRFHAQPNACPVCGPQLELWNSEGEVLAAKEVALTVAIEAVRAGKILALKGIGGFQLLADASNERAVQLLRERKHRPDKPFALLYLSLAQVKRDCHVSAAEQRLLCSVAAPIVLLQRKKGAPAAIAPNVAPGIPALGVMLPYSPLHHLLLHALNSPVVATSGNLSNEPICTDNQEALRRLNTIADVFLVHDRPISRPLDDAVVHVVAGQEQVLRLARGYAPLALPLSQVVPPILAVGAHLKNTVAVSNGQQLVVSQHIGDLGTAAAYAAFRNAVTDLQQLYEVSPRVVAADRHPDYLSTKYGQQLGLPVVEVQHHYAHVLACMADNGIKAPVLGIALDGTGLGTDGTIWGGEFLRVRRHGFERVAHFHTFRLPGGEAAVREPRRAALGMLYEVYGDEMFETAIAPQLQDFTKTEVALLRQMLHKNLNTPVTSSSGRLFDGVAALLGLRQKVSFEGQAAMELEFAARQGIAEVYPITIAAGNPGVPAVIDWRPMLLQLMDDLKRQVARGVIAARFHNTLAESILLVARQIGEQRVVLTGGCFQNRYLAEKVVARLQQGGFTPYWHRRIPPNDGGLAVGQLLAAAAAGILKNEDKDAVQQPVATPVKVTEVKI